MTKAEFDQWWAAASPAAAQAASQAARHAMEDWHVRLADRLEQADLEVACNAGRLCPVDAVRAAGQCAAEVEILMQIWPTRPDAVLRPGRSAPGHAVR